MHTDPINLSMPISCTIKNDTDFVVWITHGGTWNSLLDSIAAASTKRTVQADGAEETDGPGLNVMGPSMSRMDIVLRFEANALANVFGMSQEIAERLKKEVTAFVNGAQKIGPGESYTWDSALPQTMRIVYVLKDTLQCDGRACTTGFFGNNEYAVSERFEFQTLGEQ